MRLKSPHRNEATEREERELQLRDFITSNLDGLREGADCVLLFARAPDSLPARIVFALSETLAARNLGARFVFAGAAAATSGDAWRLNFDPAFGHETRIVRDPRYLDGHEQLILGGRSVWFGDSMRREPDKRDAFTHFVDGCEPTAASCRATFGRIWKAAVPVYAHGLAAQSLAAQPLAQPAPAAAASIQPKTESNLPPGGLETLEAWQVSTRH